MRRIVTVIIAGLAALLVGGSAAQPPASGDEVIAYLGGVKIYLINADGTERQAIVSGAINRALAWSPDASKIAFTAGKAPVRYVDDKSEIRVVSADGSNVRLVTRGPSRSAANPTWSPDGRQIAFDAWNKREQHSRIYVVDAEGTSGLRAVTRGSAEDSFPDWSPDGEWIAFERIGFDKEGEIRPIHSLMAIHPDGTGLHRIAKLIGGPQCLCPDWSPDGSKIAYQASTTLATKKYPEIFVMNADGNGKTQLTRNRIRDENPDWSPDGTKIAFYSERRGNAEIYVIDVDGHNVKRITRDPWYSSLPRWRPQVTPRFPPPPPP